MKYLGVTSRNTATHDYYCDCKYETDSTVFKSSQCAEKDVLYYAKVPICRAIYDSINNQYQYRFVPVLPQGGPPVLPLLEVPLPTHRHAAVEPDPVLHVVATVRHEAKPTPSTRSREVIILF